MNQGFRHIPEVLFNHPTGVVNPGSALFPYNDGGDVFYTCQDGKWTDPKTWKTVSGRWGKFPTAKDDVYIKHTVLNNLSTAECNNLYISNTGTYAIDTTAFPAGSLIVNGNLKSFGNINLVAASLVTNFTLKGADNYMYGTLTMGNFNTFSYAREGDQDVMNLPYSNLYITGKGTKRLINDLIIGNNLSVVRGHIQLGWYKLTVTGTSQFTNQNQTLTTASLRKSHFGEILFIGGVDIRDGFQFNLTDSNSNVEFRGGLTGAFGANVSSGTGIWRFTTNNQTVAHPNVPVIYDCYFEIASGITVTATGNSRWQINNDIEGVDGTSVLDNRGVIGYAGTTMPMDIGVLECDNVANTFIYNGYNQSIQNVTYWNIYLIETTTGIYGTKTATGNLVVLGALSIQPVNTAPQGRVTLELGTYDLIVSGATTILGHGTFSKSGAGNLTFIGLLNVSQFNASFNLSGNPNVELRGGVTYYGAAGTQNTGTGVWSFTTNNQTITNQYTNFILGKVEIVGNITVSLITVGTYLQINDYLNGTVAGSTFLNRGSLYMNTTTLHMGTGVLDITSFANTIGYIMATNYTLPLTAYSSLFIGNSGIKSLGGNTTLTGSLGLGFSSGGSCTLECSTYDLVVSGTYTQNGLSTFSKNGAGSLLFVGQIGIEQNGGSFVLTGNPTVECRGNFTYLANTFTFNSGTGQWRFTTNNQVLRQRGTTAAITFNGPVLIEGIQLTIDRITSGMHTVIFNDTVDGTNSSSILDNREMVYYNSPTAPMVTGKLYCNQNTVNIFRYSLNGNQDITVPQDPVNPGYRNLVLETGGAKRLLGNVSVKGTYTLTAPATLDNNGFTLTNP